MQTIALEKAQATLADLLRQVAGGEEFTITQNGEPKAKLSPVPPSTHLKNGILVHHAGKPISSQDVANVLAMETTPAPADEKPLLKLLQALEALPENPDWPTDGAAQHDHYLYGLPKRP